MGLTGRVMALGPTERDGFFGDFLPTGEAEPIPVGRGAVFGADGPIPRRVFAPGDV